MNNGGDAAEQIVRLSLEGFEVAARLTGSAAKNVALLLAAALKQETKTKGKARLTSMIRSGKELKVFAIPQRDVKKFTEQAKRYGVLYCVLRDRNSKDENAPVDIIARAEDASKIQRIVDRFELGKVDKASILGEVEKSVAEREDASIGEQKKSRGEIIVEEAMGKVPQSESRSQENPSAAKTEKGPPSAQRSEDTGIATEKGAAPKDAARPSVREKLERIRASQSARKETERAEPQAQEKSKAPQKNAETVHKQPQRKRTRKERS